MKKKINVQTKDTVQKSAPRVAKSQKKTGTGKSLLVNLTDVNSPSEVKAAFVLAKVNAGKVITSDELTDFSEYIIEVTLEMTNKLGAFSKWIGPIFVKKETKKRNILVRFWNWLKGLFKKKK